MRTLGYVVGTIILGAGLVLTLAATVLSGSTSRDGTLGILLLGGFLAVAGAALIVGLRTTRPRVTGSPSDSQR